MKKIIFFLLCAFILNMLYGQNQIVIYHSNNVNGKLENCLCDEQPYGALEKITAFVKAERSKKTPMLAFDSGDFFSPFEGRKKNNMMLEALKVVKFDAMGVGDQEFALGPGFFIDKVLKTGAAYLSANLTIDGKSVVPADKIFTKGKVKIAVCSVLGEDVFKFYPEASILGIGVTNPREAVKKWLAKTKKADIHVLLSHLGLDDDKKIAKEIPGIDLIIGGHTQEILKEPVKIGNTHLFEAGSEGYYLGKIILSLDKKHKIQTLDYQLIPMELSLANDPQIAALAVQYDFSFIEKSMARIGTFTALDEKYLVSDAGQCVQCHEKQTEHWRGTAHYKSYQTLEAKKKIKNHKCISCHVSGYGRNDGFINVNLTKELAPVTCTECHYTNESHLKKKDKKSVRKIVTETCIRCHDQENDPDFDFSKALKMVRCTN